MRPRLPPRPSPARCPPWPHAVAALLALQLAGCTPLQARPARQADDPSAEIAAFAVGASALVGAIVVIAVIKSNSSTSASSPKPSPLPPPASESDEVTMLGWSFEQRDGQATWRRCASRTFCTDERVAVDAADLVEATKSGRVVPIAMGGDTLGEVDLYVLRLRGRGTPPRR
jgi:hypothetical protein